MHNAGLFLNKLRNDGFIILKNVFTRIEQNILISYADKLYDLPEVKNSYMKYYENTENGRILSRVENFYKTDYEFAKLVNFKISPIINTLHREPMAMFKDKINWKLPGGGAFKPHQDHGAWDDFPPKYFVTCAVFADNSTRENGCLEMGIGHKPNKVIANTDGVINQNEVDKLGWKPVLVSPADMVIFDAFVPHRSQDNNSDSPRRVYYFTYNYREEGNHYKDYFKKKRIELPPDFERVDHTEYNLKSKYNLANPIS